MNDRTIWLLMECAIGIGLVWFFRAATIREYEKDRKRLTDKTLASVARMELKWKTRLLIDTDDGGPNTRTWYVAPYSKTRHIGQ